jgi:hypothetical protein
MARMRTEFWPEVTDDMIWHLADVKISPTYLALWCHAFDEGS